MKEALNKGALVPFHYYGIYDETDYSTLKLVKGRYDETDLNDKYIGNVKRYEMCIRDSFRSGSMVLFPAMHRKSADLPGKWY